MDSLGQMTRSSRRECRDGSAMKLSARDRYFGKKNPAYEKEKCETLTREESSGKKTGGQ